MHEPTQPQESTMQIRTRGAVRTRGVAPATRTREPVRTRGAVITSVRDGSPAQEAGLQQGDLVLEVDRRPVQTADDAVKALSADRAGGHLLRVRRGDAALFVIVPTA